MDQSRPLLIVTTLFYHWFQTNYPRGNGGTISGVVRGGARSGVGVERLDPHTMMMIERVRGVILSCSYVNNYSSFIQRRSINPISSTLYITSTH
jgi:ribulose-5-phosphate 4-epimerase/fuculose-1-phosphate aldolase